MTFTRTLAFESIRVDDACMPLRIELAAPSDLRQIRAAYDDARRIQRERRSSLWPEFSDSSILAEIVDRRLWRVMDDDVLAGVFTVAYDDAAIWGERERGAHIYLHRVARSASHRASGLVNVVVAWARAHCHALGREGIRMDTWGDNAALIAYYERLGFTFLGRQRIGVEPRLPPHYHNSELALLEMACADSDRTPPACRR